MNLVTLGDYYDVALRDFGLFVAALALARRRDERVSHEPTCAGSTARLAGRRPRVSHPQQEVDLDGGGGAGRGDRGRFLDGPGLDAAARP